jgi:hypothetical protein
MGNLVGLATPLTKLTVKSGHWVAEVLDIVISLWAIAIAGVCIGLIASLGMIHDLAEWIENRVKSKCQWMTGVSMIRHFVEEGATPRRVHTPHCSLQSPMESPTTHCTSLATATHSPTPTTCAADGMQFDEFFSSVQEMGVALPRPAALQLFQQADVSKDGSIDKQESKRLLALLDQLTPIISTSTNSTTGVCKESVEEDDPGTSQVLPRIEAGQARIEAALGSLAQKLASVEQQLNELS